MFFEFGETIPDYKIKVINERVARAGAGILFLFATISFFNALLLGNFTFTKIFVTFFMIDFMVRVLINPKYSPSLILGKYFVRYQKPEWVGAPQKRWAWSIGLMLSIIMFLTIVVFEYMTPIKIAICVLCLSLLFSEAVFGICLGCKIYKILNKSPQYCSGESCTLKTKQTIDSVETFILIITVISIIGITINKHNSHTNTQNNNSKCQTGKCQSGKCGI